MPSRQITAEIARTKILDKLRQAGGKGVSGFTTARTAPGPQAAYAQALGELLLAGEVAQISAGKKAKYFAREFAPSAASVGGKIEQYAALQHPKLLAQSAFGKALTAVEKPLLAEALHGLLSRGHFVQLRSGAKHVYAHAESLRGMLGLALADGSPKNVPILEPEKVRHAYASLVSRTGFPDVEIAALRREAEVALPELRTWLVAEHDRGHANFALGDWSLASEEERAAAVELRSQRYLLVRLED
jgi:hypothetical protein